MSHPIRSFLSRCFAPACSKPASPNRFARLALLAFTLCAFAFLALQTPAPAVAQSRLLPVESLLLPDGTLNPHSPNGTVDLRGWNVALDPARGPLLEKTNAAPALNDSWSALPHNGLNSTVYALAVFDNALYAGGFFAATADGSVTNLNSIAKFDGANWSALPHNGLNAAVTALAVFENVLYVGGEFTGTADGSVTNLNHIARFDGTNWSALPHNGLDASASTMAVFDHALYVGGVFTRTSDSSITNLNSIAKFDGTDWSALPYNGLDAWVSGLGVFDNALYVGGAFTASADGSVTNLNHIAGFNGTHWFALPHNGLDSSVSELVVFDNGLYVGGIFTGTADAAVTNLNHIARFDGANWSALPQNGLTNDVYALAVYGNTLYVGGNFSATADGTVTYLDHIAKFDGTTWSALPHNGLNGTVFALTASGSALYVGGAFTASADGGVTNLNRIAELSFTPTQTGPTFLVHTNADTDDGLCDTLGQGNGFQDCTLREAIHAANAQGGANTIHFAADYSILLTNTLPTIADDLTIDGETHKVFLDGAGAHRLLVIHWTILDVAYLTFLNGNADNNQSYGASGGAIYNDGGTLTVRSSSFLGNHAAKYGGALFGDGITHASNCTFVGNSSDNDGGAIGAFGVLNVLNSTLFQNTSIGTGGISNWGTLTLINTVIAESTGPDCGSAGSIANEKNNLIEDTGSSACGLVNTVNGDKIGVNAGMGTIGDWGGVTQTVLLYTTSPALDAGDDATCAASPVSGVDQRGSSRLQGAHCDIGAFEKAPTDCQVEPPAAFLLLKPANNAHVGKPKVKFDWQDAMCGTTYKLTAKNVTTHARVNKSVTSSKTKIVLGPGTWKWFVQACSPGVLCTKSKTFKFNH